MTARRQRLRELLEDCRIADAVYEDTPERFAEVTILERDDILLFEHEADHFRSAYSIALVPDRKEVRPERHWLSRIAHFAHLAGRRVSFPRLGRCHCAWLAHWCIRALRQTVHLRAVRGP